MNKIAAVLFLAFGMLTNVSANERKIAYAFGGSPGAEVPHRMKCCPPDTPNADYTVHYPAVNKTLKVYFHDVRIRVNKDPQQVVSIEAERAMIDRSGCVAGVDALQEMLRAFYPQEIAGDDPAYQYQSSNGEVSAGVQCMTGRHFPYPVLSLKITHHALRQVLDKP